MHRFFLMILISFRHVCTHYTHHLGKRGKVLHWFHISFRLSGRNMTQIAYYNIYVLEHAHRFTYFSLSPIGIESTKVSFPFVRFVPTHNRTVILLKQNEVANIFSRRHSSCVEPTAHDMIALNRLPLWETTIKVRNGLGRLWYRHGKNKWTNKFSKQKNEIDHFKSPMSRFIYLFQCLQPKAKDLYERSFSKFL